MDAVSAVTAQRSRVPLVLAAVPILAAVVGVAGPLLEVVDSTSLMSWVLALLPLCGLATVGRWREWSPWESRFLFTALALLTLMAAIQLLNPNALTSGWWRWIERSAAASCALVVFAARLPLAVWVKVMGASAAAASIVVAVLSWWYGYLSKMNTVIVGFPHVNAFTGTVTPVLLAWGTLLLVKREPIRKAWRDWMLLMIGLAGLLVVVVLTGRRGAALAMIGVAAWFGWRHITARWRWLGWSLAIISCVIAGIILAAIVNQDVLQPRYQRVLLFGAGCEVAVDGKFLGSGHYSAFHAQWSDGEYARRLTAMGQWMAHVHNEFLDVLMDGGLAALILFAGLLAISWRCVVTVANRAHRAAGEAMLIACGVHLLTDNFLGQHVGQHMLWLIMAVIISGMSQKEAPKRLPASLASMFALGLASIALVGCWMGASAAFVRWGATEAVKMRVLESSWNPQVVDHWTRDLAQSAAMSENVEMAERVYMNALPKIGMGGSLPVVRRQIAMMKQNDAELIDADLTLIQRRPFEIMWYQEIERVLRRQPKLLQRIPEEVRRRMRLLMGSSGKSTLDAYPSRSDFDAALDDWAIAHGLVNQMGDRDWGRISAILRRLVHHYGDIPGVIDLLILAMMDAPPEAFGWVSEEQSALAVGYWTNHQSQTEAWSVVQTREEACQVLPLIRVLHPELIKECETGMMSPIASEGAIPLRNTIVGIWGLSRRGKAP